jgi:putative transposase
VSRFRFIEAEKAHHPISLMCRMLGVSRSGFHAWQHRPPSQRELSDAWLSERIRAIHSEDRGVYGAPRVDLPELAGCRRRDSNPRHADYDSAALTD